MTGDHACLHVILEGSVQGVGFRAFVVDGAHRLGVTGWVRNKGDEQVEVLAEGSRANLEALLELLRQGPRMARVEQVKPDWVEPSGKYNRFSMGSSV